MLDELLKKWFIPCAENNYEPHLLRAWPVAVLTIAIVGFFGVSQLMGHSLVKNNNLAAVIASVLVDLTNSDRAGQGLGGLIVNPTLQQVAQLKANDMAAKSYFAHNSPDGKTPWYWFSEAGYDFSYAGENLAVFFGDSADVERAWMNSPGHRANILNGNFTEIGIATAEGVYEGQPTVFVVQVFGTPAIKAPIATLTSQPGTTATVVDATPADSGTVGGESIQTITEDDVTLAENAPADEPDVKILQEDDTFIAVKDASMQSAPSNGSVESQASFWQRVMASPQTVLTRTYTLLAGLITLALIFLIFLEMRVQRVKSILFGVGLLVLITALLYFSQTNAVVASVQGLSQVVNYFS